MDKTPACAKAGPARDFARLAADLRQRMPAGNGRCSSLRSTFEQGEGASAMMIKTYLPRALAALGCVTFAACTSNTSATGVGSTGSGLCDDFTASGNIDANLDANVK